MDLGLTEDQELLKSTAANFVQQEYSKETLVGLEKTPTGITSELLRKAVDLGWFGIALDPAKNQSANGEAPIHDPASRVQIWIMPTNEELIVARQARELLAVSH